MARFERYQLVEQREYDTEDGIPICRAYDTATGRYVTMKIIPRGPAVTRDVERAVLNLHILSHPYIAKLVEVVLNDEYLAVVLDYVPGQSLGCYIHRFGPLREHHARSLFQQLLLAVDYCHRHDIVVRSIRVDSLALNSVADVIKLASFQLTKKSNEPVRPRTFLSDCDYAAPEVLRACGRVSYEPIPVDIWGLGVCLYHMIYGYFPFANYADTNDNRIENTVARIQTAELKTPSYHLLTSAYQEEELSADCVDLIKRLLVKDPNQRITIASVMSHPWFREDLPLSALTLNDSLESSGPRPITMDSNTQTRGVVRDRLREATQPVRGTPSS